MCFWQFFPEMYFCVKKTAMGFLKCKKCCITYKLAFDPHRLENTITPTKECIEYKPRHFFSVNMIPGWQTKGYKPFDVNCL